MCEGYQWDDAIQAASGLGGRFCFCATLGRIDVWVVSPLLQLFCSSIAQPDGEFGTGFDEAYCGELFWVYEVADG